MSTMTALAAYDWLRFAPGFLERLQAVRDAVAQVAACPEELVWVDSLCRRLAPMVEHGPAILARARTHPDLEPIKGEQVEEAIDRWGKALEAFDRAIRAHAGSRSPVLEALFPKGKLPVTRGRPEVARQAADELHRRLNTGYVQRMLQSEDFAFAPKLVEALTAALAEWTALLEPADPPDDEALRTLVAHGEALERCAEQALLVSQAALLPLGRAPQDFGLEARPRKRSGGSLGARGRS